jgi:acetyl-CoA acetyltransferase family protein
MKFDNVFIPYSYYWSTPFCKWQGAFANEHSVQFAATCAQRMLSDKNLDPSQLERLHYGQTIPQQGSFYGAPWVAALMGNDRITGPTLAQACATSARVLASAATELQLGEAGIALAMASDRLSNGPILSYPNPEGPGGAPDTEVWVLDSFTKDPYARCSMVQTAENVAQAGNISRHQQDELALHRYEQYEAALANDFAFQRRYMQRGIQITDARKRNVLHEVSTDQGITRTTAAGLGKLKPVLENGTVTFGTQTHPADGNAGMIMVNKNTLAQLGVTGPQVQILSFAESRVEKAHMGMAPVPAAQKALEAAGLQMDQIKAIKTHNPFVVNDIYFAQKTGFAVEKMNNFGSSLIFGHPQGPTGMRLIIELIEELEMLGGGYGVFSGCAAGDSAAAIVLNVT